ncbi:MAG TPA: hypothetical protein VHO69_07185 [Phototrophicaceae bacterium]|nr:hypothetical protein [Phototrophicaceae bacterium]
MGQSISEAISKEKTKRGERRSRAAIEFVVPLQLEQCLYHINHQPLGMPLRVTVAPVEDGTLHLTALLRHNGIVTVRCEGELRRWEGTCTQVVGQRENSIADSKTENEWKTACGCVIAMMTLPLVASVTGFLNIKIPVPLNFAAGFAILLGLFLMVNGVWRFVHHVMSLSRQWSHRRELIVRLKRVLNGTEKY